MRRIAIVLVAAILCILCASCQKEKVYYHKATVTVSTQPNPKNVPSAAAGEKFITILPTDNWTATVDVDWITVDPASGVRGTQEVKLTYTANTTGSDRVGVVTFTAAEGSDTYTFTQSK